MEITKQLLGRLHPLIVHLPIGIILFGLGLQWYDRKNKEHQKVLPLLFLWGGYSAVAACVTGYLQYLSEGYAFETVKWHLWLGIATALFSFILFVKTSELAAAYLKKIPVIVFSAVVFVLVSLTGHKGGSITHGADYLVAPLPNSVKAALGFETFEEKQIVLNETNWEEALLYEDVIQPILNNNCVSCHNPKKTKGGLVLHNPEAIIKGGDSGEVLIAKNADTSELYHRMMLPMRDDKHMPPDGKTQPSKEEIKLIGAWINTGYPFTGSIKEAGLAKELFLSFFPTKHDYDFPDKEITAAAQDSITVAKNIGVHVDLISTSSNFLSVSAINKPSFSDTDYKYLVAIKNNIARLDLGGTQITDVLVAQLKHFPNLTVLKLDNTAVTGSTLNTLQELEHLKSINLTASKFDVSYMKSLTTLAALQRVYLYGTIRDSSGIQLPNHGKIMVDYGNYQLPSVASDTIVY